MALTTSSASSAESTEPTAPDCAGQSGGRLGCSFWPAGDHLDLASPGLSQRQDHGAGRPAGAEDEAALAARRPPLVA